MGTFFAIARIEAFKLQRRETLFKVFGDGRGFIQADIINLQRGHTAGQRQAAVFIVKLCIARQVNAPESKGNALLGKRNIN
ncbi:hypothetical protein E05_23170 [Plautia stali symbiont]|nr:hypothetical protein E05_23170 [Plautia stali symbiont]